MWLPVVGFENLYEVSDSGIVRSAKSGRVIPVKSGKVTLSKKGAIYLVAVDLITKESVTESAKELVEQFAERESCYLASALNDRNGRKWVHTNESKIVGDIGEHLVCVELLARGVRAGVSLMEGAAYDVIGDFGNGYLFKIQVKTIPAPTNGEYRFSTKDLSYLKTCDVMAYVSLKERSAVFCLCSEMNTPRKLFKESEFRMLSGKTIDYVLDKLYSRFERQMCL